MKILVLGGMHGNEPLGIELVKLIESSPIKNIDALLANVEATKFNKRFIKVDLNRSFPGNLKSKDYESKRAAEIIKICKRYDLILDFHNTHCPNNNCSFIGKTAKNVLFDISSWLRLNRVIIADYDCLNKYAPNCLSIEISLGSKSMNPRAWYKKLVNLSKLNPIPKGKKLAKYQFIYRITLEDNKRLNLENKNLKAFKPMSKILANQLNVKSPAYPIFIADKFTPYNYGGILNKQK